MDKLNFGIIGMGKRGTRMLDLMMKTGLANPKAICDISSEKLDSFAPYKDKNICFYTDYRRLLEDKSIDALFITTPDRTHGEVLFAALRAGKHVICEKPLEISEEKINEILQKCQNCGSVIALGYVLRYSALFAKVKQLIKEGAIGRVISVNAVDNINYGGYAFFHDWHRLRENTTSLLLQKASHSLDIINWLVDSRPAKVAAFGGLDVFGRGGAMSYFGREAEPALHCADCERSADCPESIENMEKTKGIKWSDQWPDSCVFSSEIDVDDNQSLIIQYENNAKLSYTLNQFAAKYKREYNLIGNIGQLRFDDVSNKIVVTSRQNNDMATYEVANSEAHGGGDEGLLKDFLHCCRTGETPLANLKSGAVSALLALGAQKSIDENRIVTIEYNF